MVFTYYLTSSIYSFLGQLFAVRNNAVTATLAPAPTGENLPGCVPEGPASCGVAASRYKCSSVQLCELRYPQALCKFSHNQAGGLQLPTCGCHVVPPCVLITSSCDPCKAKHLFMTVGCLLPSSSSFYAL